MSSSEMADHAIEVTGIGKRLRLGEEPQAYGRLTESLQSAIGRIARSLGGFRPDSESRRDFWALREISFTVDAGEVLGLIGHNGAGKTTLLRILSRISPPTEGVARLRGRVGSLLDVGTGFHPELTGRENIYLYGAVLGMHRSEVRARFGDIVSFAEVEPFIDTPLKRYSSGMYLRLGFAVAAHLEPEILFVDEILAVGDLSFQQRCVQRMAEIAEGGATIIFVSHNLALISAICTRACLLERGHLIAEGPVDTVLARYTSSVQKMSAASLEERHDRQGSGDVVFTGVEVEGARGEPMAGDDLVLRLSYRARSTLRQLVVSASVFGPLGEPLVVLSNKLTGEEIGLAPKEGELRCTIPRLPLAPARYSLSLQLESGGVLADSISRAYFFDVMPGEFFGNREALLDRRPLFFVDHSWSVSSVQTGSDVKESALR